MIRLVCCFLGPPEVRLESSTEISLPTRHELALLVYLAMEPRAHQREALMTLLWGGKNPRVARTSLRQSLYRLRQSLPSDDSDTPYLHVSPQSVALNPECLKRLDVHQFTTLLDRWEAHAHNALATCSECLAALRQAVALYRGDFLSGFSLDSSSMFEEWVVLQRERFHYRYLEALYVLTEAYLYRGEYQRARQYAWKQVSLEPWREEAHRQLMEIMARSGHRQEALAQYQTCCNVLQREFNLPPSRETTALYERIRSISHEPHHNLPSPLTSFVGRANELAELNALLAHPDARLITIVGFGGEGKTRLALQAAQHNRQMFFGGVTFVPLADIEAKDGLIPVLGEALGLRFRQGEGELEQITNYLAGKETLLLFDSFERFVQHSEVLHTILTRAPRVKILVTSQVALQLSGEWLFPLSGLAWQAQDEGRSTPDAVRLFLQRARQANPLYSEAPADRARIAEVCAMLNGNPLAIELAATSLALESLEQLARSLSKTLENLRGQWTDIPPRQRSLTAMLDYAWQLLREEEQHTMKRLSVFRGGFCLQAAREVAQTAPFVLASLAQKSLIQREDDDRFNLHPLIQEFAAKQLVASAVEAEAARKQHARFFARLLETLEPLLHGSKRQEAYSQIRVDFENILAAWRRAVCQRDFTVVDAMTDVLYRYHLLRGWFQEGVSLFASALEQVHTSQGQTDANTTVLAGRLQARYGMLLYYLGRHDESQAQLEASLSLLRHKGRDAAFALNSLGILASTRGEYDRGQRFFNECLEHYQVENVPWAAAVALNNLGILARIQGEYKRAEQLSKESLSLARKVKDPDVLAKALQNLGNVSICQQDWPAARSYYQQSLDLWRQLDERWSMALALGNLGELCLHTKEYEQAIRYLEESLALRKEMGDRWGIAATLKGLGLVERIREDYSLSETYLAEAVQTAMEIPSHPLALDILLEFAALWVKRGEKQRGLEALAFVMCHPACEAHVHDQAQSLWEEVIVDVSSQLQETLQERARDFTLEEMVKKALHPAG